MSGGRFDYQQYRLNDIADSIEKYVDGKPFEDNEGKEYYLNELKHRVERWGDDRDKKEYDYVKDNDRTIPNEYEYSDKTIEEFRKGIKIIRLAKVYADRIDWLLSGDDGEEEFHKRLQEDINNI